MANGHLIPNLGETELRGSGAINSHPMKLRTQVAEVTKPLAAAAEYVDAGKTIILHRTRGIIKKLSHQAEKAIRDIVKADEGPETILERRGGAFTFDIDVNSGVSHQHKQQQQQQQQQQFHSSSSESSGELLRKSPKM